MSPFDALVARLRFRHLKLVLALSDAFSLNAAAQSLNLTQPAISKSLKELEESFGCRLFERRTSARGGTGLQPTVQGLQVIQAAKRLLNELQRLQTRTQAETPEELFLRVGAPATTAYSRLPTILASLMRGSVPIRAELVEDKVPRLFERLLDGEIEAMVSSYNTAMMQVCGSEAVDWHKLGDEVFWVIAPQERWVAEGTVMTWSQLARERWILPAAPGYIRLMAETAFARAGQVPPRPVLESASSVTNLALVAEGVGFSIVPAALARSAPGGNSACRVLVEPALPTVPVGLFHRHGDAESLPAIAALLEAARWVGSQTAEG